VKHQKIRGLLPKVENYRLKDKKRFHIKTTEKQDEEKENVERTSETTI